MVDHLLRILDIDSDDPDKMDHWLVLDSLGYGIPSECLPDTQKLRNQHWHQKRLGEG